MAFRAARTTKRMKVVLTMGLSGEESSCHVGPMRQVMLGPHPKCPSLPFEVDVVCAMARDGVA